MRPRGESRGRRCAGGAHTRARNFVYDDIFSFPESGGTQKRRKKRGGRNFHVETHTTEHAIEREAASSCTFSRLVREEGKKGAGTNGGTGRRGLVQFTAWLPSLFPMKNNRTRSRTHTLYMNVRDTLYVVVVVVVVVSCMLYDVCSCIHIHRFDCSRLV